MNLREIIVSHAPMLQPKVSWADAASLLAAIAEVESSFGLYNLPKHEKIFDYGGKYFNRDLWEDWGAWAACSYSSFQIMFPVACELGFRGSPEDLWNDDVAILWVLELIDRRILSKGAKTIEQFGDAYNSGSFTDSIVPMDYISKFVKAYNEVSSKYGLKII